MTTLEDFRISLIDWGMIVSEVSDNGQKVITKIKQIDKRKIEIFQKVILKMSIILAKIDRKEALKCREITALFYPNLLKNFDSQFSYISLIA